MTITGTLSLPASLVVMACMSTQRRARCKRSDLFAAREQSRYLFPVNDSRGAQTDRQETMPRDELLDLARRALAKANKRVTRAAADLQRIDAVPRMLAETNF